MRAVELVISHHTGTPERAPGDYPSLRVVRDGRAGLPGPLAQYGLGRSGNIYVLAAGLSYHAGASAYAGFVDLNDESVGIEAEDSGDGRWTPDELFMYPRLVGACLYFIRRGTDRSASHRTVARPAGRKPDPAGISDDWMRQHAAAFLHGQGQEEREDDMSWDEPISTPSGKTYKARELEAWTNHFANMIPGITAQIAGLTTAVNRLAEAVAADSDELTAEELKAAVREAIEEGLVRVQGVATFNQES